MSLYGKNLGKTISLYLMDGTASGRWQVTLVNWSGIVYGIPHSELKKCIGMAELNTPGVYFLFGRDDRTGKPFVYVGEADDTYKRLLQEHSFEKEGITGQRRLSWLRRTVHWKKDALNIWKIDSIKSQ